VMILKHVEYEFCDATHVAKLLKHLRETMSRVEGVRLEEIYFPKGKREFVLAISCVDEGRYLEWRDICPSPTGAKDWYEVYLTLME